MRKLIALLISTGLLVGCTSTAEVGEVSSAIQESQGIQSEVEDTQDAQPEGEPLAYDLASEVVDDTFCKLEEQSVGRQKEPDGNASSFPAPSPAGLTVDVIGSIDIKVVFLEWEDLRGTQADYDFHVELLEKAKDFYWVMSEGKLNLNYDFETNWNLVQGSYKDSYIPDDESGGSWDDLPFLQPKIDAFVEAADPSVDFLGAEAVFFAFPTAEMVVEGGGLHTFHFGNAIARTDEGDVGNLFSSGSRVYDHADEVQGWAVFAHEFGHTLRFPDLRDWSDGKDQLGPDEFQMYLVNPMYGIDTMDNQDAGTQGISGWMKWVWGWLDDSQVTCVDAATVDSEYYRLDEANLMKADNEMLVVRLSDTEALIVESRRWDERYDRPIAHARDGVIVYRLDTTRGHAEGPLRLLSPRDITQYLNQENVWPDWRVLDVYLFENDYVEMDGIRITNVQSEESADTVLIEAIGS